MTARLWALPAPTAATPEPSPLTATGLVRFVVVPSPTSPTPLSPQPNAAPPWTQSSWNPPPASAVTEPGTEVALGRSAIVRRAVTGLAVGAVAPGAPRARVVGEGPAAVRDDVVDASQILGRRRLHDVVAHRVAVGELAGVVVTPREPPPVGTAALAPYGATAASPPATRQTATAAPAVRRTDRCARPVVAALLSCLMITAAPRRPNCESSEDTGHR